MWYRKGWYKKEKLWNILSAIALSLSTIGFGVMVVTVDRWIDSQNVIRQEEQDFFLTYMNKIDDQDYQLSQARLFKETGTTREAYTEAISLAKETARSTILSVVRVQIHAEGYPPWQPNKPGELQRRSLESQKYQYWAEKEKIDKMEKFEEIYRYQKEKRSEVWGPLFRIDMELDTLKKRIRKWNKWKMIIWSCLLFVQGLGLTFGVLGHFGKEHL